MKLRRALAVTAAAAALAPAALLAGPAAYATEDTTPTPSSSAPEDPEPTEEPSESADPTGEPTQDPTGEPTQEPTGEPTDTPTTGDPTEDPTEEPTEGPTEEPTEEPTEGPTDEPTDEPTDPAECVDSKVDVDIKGLSGKIAAGSGWHKFSLTVLNASDSTLKELFFVAGASADKDGQNLFKTKQVEIQAYNPDDKSWESIGTEGYVVGVVGWADELKPDHFVDIPMRLNVKPGAPAGAGFSLGGSVYTDEDAECQGFGEVAYKFQIVAAGTSTGGTKPQTGGQVPALPEKPSKKDATKVTGELAETGSSSALPTIGLIGGLTVVAGAGVVFAVKRRKGEGATA